MLQKNAAEFYKLLEKLKKNSPTILMEFTSKNCAIFTQNATYIVGYL